MSQLQIAVTRLSGFLTPPVGYSNEIKIFLPEPGDPNAAFKRELIDRGNATLDSGQAALASQFVEAIPELGDDDFQKIESLLADDPERRDFFEFANAIDAVAFAFARSRAAT
jgi:hypothetical protein